MLFCACCANEEEVKEVTVVEQPVEAPVDLDLPLAYRDLAAEELEAKTSVIGPVPEEIAPSRLGALKTRDFEIQIDKEGGSMGIDISTSDDKTFLVTKIKDGPVSKWNHSAAPDERVRRGDRIVACNGCGEDSDGTGLLEVMKSSAVQNMRIRRISEFRVAIGKADKLGLEADESQSTKLIVKAVSEGAVRVANKKNKADLEICMGDEIVDVNGIIGDAKTLMDIMLGGDPLQLRVQRLEVC